MATPQTDRPRLLTLEEDLARAIVRQNQNAASAVIENERANKAEAEVLRLTTALEERNQTLNAVRRQSEADLRRLTEERDWYQARMAEANDSLNFVLPFKARAEQAEARLAALQNWLDWNIDNATRNGADDQPPENCANQRREMLREIRAYLLPPTPEGKT